MDLSISIPDHIVKALIANPGAGRRQLNKVTGLSERLLRFYCKAWKERTSDPIDSDGKVFEVGKVTEEEKSKLKQDYGLDKGSLEYNSFTNVTLEDLLEIAEVDLEKWAVERFVTNSWQVTMKLRDSSGRDIPETKTNYQVKAWLKPKVVQPLETAIKNLIKEIPKFKPENIKTPKYKKSEYAGELGLNDIHFAKFAWGKETNQGNLDLNINRKNVLAACADNLDHLSKYPLEKIFHVIGNDLFHIENIWATTPQGRHTLDADGRLPKVITVVKETMLKTIYMCLEVAPVEILIIPGNHDMHAAFWMGEIIKEHFRENKHVIVDNGPSPRKARLWGNLLVGWTHDASNRKEAATVNMLPQFWPDLWGKSKFREWHTGHKHKKQAVKYMPCHTVGGVVVRQLPTLSTIDYWHLDNAFVDAVPAGESFLWSKSDGVEAQFTSNIDIKKYDD